MRIISQVSLSRTFVKRLIIWLKNRYNLLEKHIYRLSLRGYSSAESHFFILRQEPGLDSILHATVPHLSHSWWRETFIESDSNQLVVSFPGHVLVLFESYTNFWSMKWRNPFQVFFVFPLFFFERKPEKLPSRFSRNIDCNIALSFLVKLVSPWLEHEGCFWCLSLFFLSSFVPCITRISHTRSSHLSPSRFLSLSLSLSLFLCLVAKKRRSREERSPEGVERLFQWEQQEE